MAPQVTVNGSVKAIEPNDLGYAEMVVVDFTPLGDRILLQWEHHQDELRVGKTTLIRPDTHKKMHYTGVVLKVGPLVDSTIQVGHRLLFDQFSNFEKYYDPAHGRLALIEERKQGSAFAIIPARTKIGAGEGDYRYDA